MTEEEIQKAKKSFADMGVPENRIFAEIMRAHYLDYNLFLNPTNAEYGVTIEDLYKNMKLTTDKLGDYTGDEDTYANVYTLAMRINPMDFAEGVAKADEELRAIILSAINKAKEAGKTVLFAGADQYLYLLPKIFYDLKDCRIAVAVKDPEWKNKLAFLFPRGRAMGNEEFFEDDEAYDYIFDYEMEDIKQIPVLKDHLSAEACMDVFLPYDLLIDTEGNASEVKKKIAADGALSEYYDIPYCGKEFALLSIKNKGNGKVSFGEARVENTSVEKYPKVELDKDAFIQADEWNHDVYLYNGSVALQTILSANIVSMEHAIGHEFRSVPAENIPSRRIHKITKDAIIEDLGLREDLVEEAVLQADTCYIKVRDGDLLLAATGNKLSTAVVYAPRPDTVVDEGVIVLRPTDKYTAEFLKLYLDGPVGKLFLNTMEAGAKLCLLASRVLRIPLPVSDMEKILIATKMCRTSVTALSEAASKWREVKREAVQLMMGK